MSLLRSELLAKISSEREYNSDSPGSEWDSKNTPGDWIALIAHYVSAEPRRKGIVPDAVEFEDTLIKGAAVILAALEHVTLMKDRGELQ
jgi:hypothetical protein